MKNTHTDSNHSSFEIQYKEYLQIGVFVCILFIACIILSSTLIKIKGAVTTTGTVMQIGENKSVQHNKGGPVKEILVEDGDLVNEGDTLIILDSVSLDSKLALLKKQQFEFQLKLDRLYAMEEGKDEFIVDVEKYGDRFKQYDIITSTQESVFISQRNVFLTTLAELETRLSGLKNEITAIDRQRVTNQQQLAILDTSLKELTDLFEKQLISKSRLTQTERDRVNVLTQLESLKVSALQKKNARNDTEKLIQKFLKENKDEIWREIETTKDELAKIDSEILSTQDEFSRLTLKSPTKGRVHEMKVKAVNEVIRAGDTILQIVPDTANLIIHAQVRPQDIDQIYFGQKTRIRFDTFDQHTTPEIMGHVLFIAADSSSSSNGENAEKYFLVKVSLEPAELEKITSAEISSGLPVSTMFTTNERSLMSYLIKPISKQLFSAFREN